MSLNVCGQKILMFWRAFLTFWRVFLRLRAWIKLWETKINAISLFKYNYKCSEAFVSFQLCSSTFRDRLRVFLLFYVYRPNGTRYNCETNFERISEKLPIDQGIIHNKLKCGPTFTCFWIAKMRFNLMISCDDWIKGITQNI